MDVKINEISASEKEVEVMLTYDEIKQDIDTEVRKQAKTVQIPGFRKGKVPPAMIKKMFGDSFEYEASEKVANTHFWKVIKEKELNPLGQPTMTDIKFNPGQDLFFKVKFEVVPEIEVNNYTGQEITIPDLGAREQDVEHELDHIKKHNRTTSETDIVGEDDNYILKVEFQRVNESEEPFEDSKPEVLDIDLTNSQVHKDIRENSKGKKAGDVFDYTFEDKYQKKKEDGTEEEITENFQYKVKILEIKKISDPEFTEDFVKKISKDKASTEDELREQIRKDIQSYFDQRTDEFIKEKLIKMVIENNDFIPPVTLVNNFLEEILKSEEEQSKKQGHKHFDKKEAANRLKPSAELQVKWFLLKDALKKKEVIRISDEDIEALAKADAEKTGIDIEKLKSYFRSSGYTEKLIDDKIFDFLIEKNTIKKVDPKELHNLKNKEENEQTGNL